MLSDIHDGLKVECADEKQLFSECCNLKQKLPSLDPSNGQKMAFHSMGLAKSAQNCSFAVPVNNAYMKQFVSVTNNIWSDERNKS